MSVHSRAVVGFRCSFDQPRVLVLLVEFHLRVLGLEESHRAGHHLEHIPLQSDTEHLPEHRESIVHRLGALPLHAALEPLADPSIDVGQMTF